MNEYLPVITMSEIDMEFMASKIQFPLSKDEIKIYINRNITNCKKRKNTKLKKYLFEIMKISSDLIRL